MVAEITDVSWAVIGVIAIDRKGPKLGGVHEETLPLRFGRMPQETLLIEFEVSIRVEGRIYAHTLRE